MNMAFGSGWMGGIDFGEPYFQWIKLWTTNYLNA